MNHTQANDIRELALIHAAAVAEARIWRQVHDALPHLSEMQQRYQHAEEARNETYLDLVAAIHAAVTE